MKNSALQQEVKQIFTGENTHIIVAIYSTHLAGTSLLTIYTLSQKCLLKNTLMRTWPNGQANDSQSLKVISSPRITYAGSIPVVRSILFNIS